MTRMPPVKFLQVVFLSYAYIVLLAFKDRSNSYLADALIMNYRKQYSETMRQ